MVVPIDKLSVLVTVLVPKESVKRRYLVGLALLVGGILVMLVHRERLLLDDGPFQTSSS